MGGKLRALEMIKMMMSSKSIYLKNLDFKIKILKIFIAMVHNSIYMIHLMKWKLKVHSHQDHDYCKQIFNSISIYDVIMIKNNY